MRANTDLKTQLQSLTESNESLHSDLNDAKDIINETRGVIKREQAELASAAKNFQESEKNYKHRMAQVRH